MNGISCCLFVFHRIDNIDIFASFVKPTLSSIFFRLSSTQKWEGKKEGKNGRNTWQETDFSLEHFARNGFSLFLSSSSFFREIGHNQDQTVQNTHAHTRTYRHAYKHFMGLVFASFLRKRKNKFYFIFLLFSVVEFGEQKSLTTGRKIVEDRRSEGDCKIV